MCVCGCFAFLSFACGVSPNTVFSALWCNLSCSMHFPMKIPSLNNSNKHTHTHIYARWVTCKALVSDGVIRRPIGYIDYWAREAGGAAAVIRAFWCGLAERKGHPLNISGRTTTREIGRGGQTKGTVPKCDDHDWQGHVPTDAETGWKDSSGSSKFRHFFSVILICGENTVKTEVIQEIAGYSIIES